MLHFMMDPTVTTDDVAVESNMPEKSLRSIAQQQDWYGKRERFHSKAALERREELRREAVADGVMRFKELRDEVRSAVKEGLAEFKGVMREKSYESRGGIDEAEDVPAKADANGNLVTGPKVVKRYAERVKSIAGLSRLLQTLIEVDAKLTMAELGIDDQPSGPYEVAIV